MSRRKRNLVIFRQSDGRTLEIRTDLPTGDPSGPPRPHLRIRRPLRWAAALLALGCFAFGLSIGLKALHERHTSESLAARLASARQSGDQLKLIQLLSEHLTHEPGDTASLAELAVLVDDHARSRRDLEQAFLAYEEILRRTPHRHDLRRRAVTVARRLDRDDDTLWHLDALRKEFPADPELATLAGDCYAAAGQPLDAVRAYLEALHHDGQDAERYLHLADVLIDNPSVVPTREEVADLKIGPELLDLFIPERVVGFLGGGDTSSALIGRIFERGAAVGRPAYEIHLAEAKYLASRGLLAEAGTAVERAVAVAPEHPEVLQAAAEWKLAQAKLPAAIRQGAPKGTPELLAEARGLMERSVALDAADPAAYLTLAEAELRSGRLGAAEKQLRAGWVRVAALDGPDGDSAAAPVPTDREGQESAGKSGRSPVPARELEARIVWSLANVLLARAAVGEAGGVDTVTQVRGLIRQLKDLDAPAALTRTLEGRVLLTEGRWAEGVGRLESAQRGASPLPADLRVPLHLMLADGYRELARFEAELNALRTAGDRAPASLALHRRLARSHESAGRFAEASESYRAAWRIDGSNGDAGGSGVGGNGAGGNLAGVKLARVLVLSEALLPEERRDERRLERAVADAEEGGASPFELATLRADAELLLGRPQEARRILVAARDAEPQRPAAWAALALFELRRPDVEHPARVAAAQNVLTEARSRLGASAELQLARVGLALESPGETVRAELARVEADPDPLNADAWPAPGDADRVMAALARAYEQIGDLARSRRWTAALVERHPEHLEFRFDLARLAALERSGDDFRSGLAGLRDVEGPDGPLGDYLESVRGIDELQRATSGPTRRGVTQESPRTAGAIRQWLERAAEARPEWEYVPLARSLLEDIAGNRVEADRCFDQAQAISQSAYAAATGSRDDEPRLPRPSIRQLLGPDVFPPIHWAVRLQLAGLLSGPHETLWPSRAAVPMPPGSLPTEECAEIAFSPLPWPGRGSTGDGDPLAEGNVRESDRMLSYTAAALEQARTDPAPGRITSRTLVLFLATLGCVILIDLLLVERLGSLWGIIALLPLTALLFPGFYFLLDLLLDLTAG